MEVKESLIQSMLVTESYDIQFGNKYSMELKGMFIMSALTIEVITNVISEIDDNGTGSVYVLIIKIENNDDVRKVPFNQLTTYQKEEIYNQLVANKGKYKRSLIKTITDKAYNGYNVPKNFVIPSIKDLLFSKVDKNYYNQRCGEVTITRNNDTDSVELSICFPNADDTAYSYDKPIEDCNVGELRAIVDSLE